MNVQFSLTASTTPKSKPEPAVNAELASSAYSAPIIRNVKDLALKEKQGVSVTLGEEQLIRNIDRAVRSLQGPETTLDISIHDKTHQIMVKVLNKDTGEVIREVPPEKTLDLVAKMMELAGIIMDEKV
ncbi:flagellar protein FlaG [Paenibacillus pini]|uniref:Flagellar protein FlaG protein n=1 Tax=Paenibacillus pini JCM 16418 TaxID=1236976 RepID=W7Z128_9BACL|nr:flagellar protein FlaG [Paenibacillus pini]GAF10696.1 flagellar protein FlaG protein [Paenibacillus pini JCM 16418]